MRFRVSVTLLPDPEGLIAPTSALRAARTTALLAAYSPRGRPSADRSARARCSGFLSGGADAGGFQAFPLLQLPPYFTLQPVRETREKQVQLWKDLILDYCRNQKIYVISLEEDFPGFSNPKIERSLSYEAKEVFLAALVNEGRAEWMDKGHKKCLILWLRIQDWANYILNLVKDNGLEDNVLTVEEIRSGIETRGTELAGIDRGVLMRALRLLEQKGKAAVFKGTSADDEGVKFSA